MMREAPRERGFTLTEVMVVVAVIGIATTLGIIYIHPQAKTLDIANRVGDVVHETSRNAVALGAVRPDVVTALIVAGNPPGVARARTRLSASGTSGAVTTFKIEKLVEDPAPATTAQWIQIGTYTTDPSVAGISWAAGTGSNAALSAGLSTSWSAFHAYCAQDGSCQPVTMFFQNLRDLSASQNYRARLSILPLGGAIYTRADWN